MRFIPLCFLLEKESMAAECNRTPHRTLMEKLIMQRVEVMRRRAHFQGLEAALWMVHIMAVRGGDLLKGFIADLIRRIRDLARNCAGLVRIPTSVHFAAARRSRPLRCFERGIVIDPICAITYCKGARDRTWRPIARRTNACWKRAPVCKLIAMQRPAHIARTPQ